MDHAVKGDDELSQQPLAVSAESSHYTEPENTSASPGPAQPLSKKAQKRLARANWTAEHKKERRAAEKERRKEKQRTLAEQRAAGELNEDGDQSRAKKKRKMGEGPKKPFQARVVVDLGFDDMMTDNEVKSLTSQLAYTYSVNRRAERPFASLLFTSLNGRTFNRLEGMSNAAYKRWVNAEWWTQGYERLWEGMQDAEVCEGPQGSGEKMMEVSGETTEDVQHPVASTSEEHANGQQDGTTGDAKRSRHTKRPAFAPRESVVYLTADSSEELTELKEDETYIIGGICDHNRYKSLCLNKSRDANIRSARLPIGTYLSELRTRKVLTVNQTFEILLKWIETRDWEQALWAVIPKRKFQEGRKRGKGGSEKSVQNEEGDEGVEGDMVTAGETVYADVLVVDERTLDEAEVEGDVEDQSPEAADN